MLHDLALGSAEPAPGEVLQQGGRVYATHCAACHGARGEGVPAIYPALAANRAVTLAAANNVVQAIRWGGFPPATAGNPRPFGMPPFGHMLSDADLAAVATFIRQSWGNQANAVGPVDVLRMRGR